MEVNGPERDDGNSVASEATPTGRKVKAMTECLPIPHSFERRGKAPYGGYSWREKSKPRRAANLRASRPRAEIHHAGPTHPVTRRRPRTKPVRSLMDAVIDKYLQHAPVDYDPANPAVPLVSIDILA